MSASLKTTNYQLPYFAEEDWIDFDAHNECAIKIDEEMKANQTAAAANADSIKNLEESVNTLGSTVNSYETRVQTLETNKDSVNEQIRVINQTDTQQNTRLTRLESDLNDIPGIVTDVTELKGKVAEIENVNTTQSTNIEKNKTEIDILDSRVEALEDGGGYDSRLPTTYTYMYAVLSEQISGLVFRPLRITLIRAGITEDSANIYRLSSGNITQMEIELVNNTSGAINVSRGSKIAVITVTDAFSPNNTINLSMGINSTIYAGTSEPKTGNPVQIDVQQNSANLRIDINANETIIIPSTQSLRIVYGNTLP